MSIAPDSQNHDNSLSEQFHLTAREWEALHWITEGKRDREIAQIMGVSPRTAQHHVGSILHKLGVETRTAAARIALTANHHR